MDIYYTSVVALTCLALLVLCILIHDNEKILKTDKLIFYETYGVVILASVAEWVSMDLNGAADWTRSIHILSKCCDYIFSPLAAFFFAKQISRSRKAEKAIFYLMMANIALEIISGFTGWIYYVDDKNYYHRGSFYILYVLTYVIAIAYVVVEFERYGTKFRNQNKSSLFAIVLLSSSGVILQEVVSSQIKVCYLTLTFGSILLYVHYLEFELQKNNEEIQKQEKLLENDVLTDLYSRYAYERYMQLNGAEPCDGFSVMVIDVNGLKNVNDTYGHPAGDELICGAAKCIFDVYHDCGRSFRVGGDEFIVLTKIDEKEFLVKKNQLLENCSKWKGNLVENLSFSCGIASYSSYSKLNLKKLVAMADKNMYIEKKNYYKNNEKR